MPPAPDPNALRRDRPSDRAWTRLEHRPADAPVPDWPLTTPSDREMELWASEWRRPQATEWLKNGEAQTVALFVRLLARAEKPDAPVTLMKYLREFRAELGISADGAARRRWTMPAAENAGPGTITALPGGRSNNPRASSGAAARARLAAQGITVVDSSAGGRAPSSAKDRFRRIDTAPADTPPF